MVFSTSEEMKLPMEIWNMEKAIKELPWYSLIKRHKMKTELSVARMVAAQAGFQIALNDLKKAGIIN